MTQIDFYVPAEKARLDRFTLACRLTEKALAGGHRVAINTASEKDAQRIDEMLWTQNDIGFIPHALHNQADPRFDSVVIHTRLQTTEEHQVLINLANDIPACFSQFERLLEPLDQNEDNLHSGRERYSYYRDCGYPIKHHEINR